MPGSTPGTIHLRKSVGADLWPGSGDACTRLIVIPADNAATRRLLRFIVSGAKLHTSFAYFPIGAALPQ
jgi:hypothetical protein